MIAPYRRLANAPLVHALAQVSFSPILEIQQSIGALQTALRDLGFVKLRVGQLQQLLVQGPSAAKVESRSLWNFANADDFIGLVISNDFVTLQTSRYADFPAFSKLLRAILNVFHHCTEVSWLTRVGLRYINLVRLSGTEDYSVWLQRELLAFPFASIRDQLTGSPQFITQSSATTRWGVLLIRTYQLTPGQFVPQELASSLVYPTAGSEKPSVALDIDHFTQLNTTFAPDQAVDAADRLHQLIRLAFEASITEHAVREWGPMEIVNAKTE